MTKYTVLFEGREVHVEASSFVFSLDARSEVPVLTFLDEAEAPVAAFNWSNMQGFIIAKGVP
jgi:hypothetical protein